MTAILSTPVVITPPFRLSVAITVDDRVPLQCTLTIGVVQCSVPRLIGAGHKKTYARALPLEGFVDCLKWGKELMHPRGP